MPNDYCTADAIKDALPDGAWGSAYDGELARLATAASRAIDLFANRQSGYFVVTADSTRYYTGSGRSEQYIDSLATTPTSVAVDESGNGSYTTWASTDYNLWPYNAVDEGVPYVRLDINPVSSSKAVWYPFQKAVRIVGKFGFGITVHPLIEQAAVIQAVRWFKRAQQGYHDSTIVPELGQHLYVKPLDPDVGAIIGRAPFMRGPST